MGTRSKPGLRLAFSGHRGTRLLFAFLLFCRSSGKDLWGKKERKGGMRMCFPVMTGAIDGGGYLLESRMSVVAVDSFFFASYPTHARVDDGV